MTSAEHVEGSPTVSVIVPAFNAAAYIAEALTSVFAQTFADYEVIVVNDGSTDATEQAIEPFQSRIVYLSQANRGLAGARNAGIDAARGRYIALLDADDVWMPEYLKTLVGMLESDPKLDIVFPNAVLFGSPDWEGKLFQAYYPATPPITLGRLLRRECFVFVSAVFRRELVEKVGGFDEALTSAEDLDLWLRAAEHGMRFGSTSEPLVRYRKRRESLSRDESSMLRSLIVVYDKACARFPASAPEQVDFEEMLARGRARIDRLHSHGTMHTVRALIHQMRLAAIGQSRSRF